MVTQTMNIAPSSDKPLHTHTHMISGGDCQLSSELTELAGELSI